MKITIIGAGPGDPDLITVKGLKLLQEADVVLYADSLVSAELINGQSLRQKLSKQLACILRKW